MRRRILSAIDRCAALLRRLCGECAFCGGRGSVDGLSLDGACWEIPCPRCSPEAAEARDFACLAAHERR